jgi:hypothetical protein
MTTTDDIGTARLQPFEEIFFRLEDRALRDSVIQAMVHEGMSLILSAPDHVTAEHYSKLIVNHLRANAGMRIEVYSPTTTEGLLERFNRILTTLSMDEAMGQRNPETPVRVLLLSHDEPISPSESRLLNRLVNNFPGANTQLVLVQTAPNEDPETKSLDIVGQRLLRWTINLPTLDEAERLLARARGTTREHEVLELLQHAAPDILLHADTPEEELPLLDADAAHAQDASQPLPPAPSSAAVRFVRTASVVLTLMAISAVIAAIAFPRNMAALRAMIGLTPAPTMATAPAPAKAESKASEQPVAAPTMPPAPPVPQPTVNASSEDKSGGATKREASEPPTAPVAPTISTPAVATPSTDTAKPPATPTPSASAAPTSPTTAAPTAPAVPAPAKPAAALATTPSKPAASAPATATATATPTKSEATPTTKPVATTPQPAAAPTKSETTATAPSQISDGSTSADVARVRGFARGEWLVQHAALESSGAADVWRAEYPLLGRSLIVPMQPVGQRNLRYVVVSGPFKSRAEAERFAASQGLPPNPWLRTVGSLQDVLPRAAATKR